ncbi:MAG: tRNA preQ1(34) S-adenosylmethionine ribosyltransferase-isomerase QueA [Betaproteobacteria bacterium]|nr:tRNA preQ1(34) S-adenosylmethionine ribosyltransferase-isomerase QueA [Betaproteobacteria bacterium]
MSNRPPEPLCLSDFDYDLPPELIAQAPLEVRSESRLLHVPSGVGLSDLQFRDLPELLSPKDLLVFNDSKVIPARLHAKKNSGGQVEILLERILGERLASAMLRASRKPKEGDQLELVKAGSAEGGLVPCSEVITFRGRDPSHDDRFLLSFSRPVLQVLNEVGEIPLPPYITRTPSGADALRYQTVFAQPPGSVAAPTAGLHFDESLLKRLDERGIQRAHLTLHVGSGTFAPVKSEDLSQHKMHAEWCSLSEEAADRIRETKQRGGRVVAVGTTSARTLESAALGAGAGHLQGGSFETSLFITPGFQFKVVDALITNFHLPKSTLLMLVSALAGYARIREAYAHAVREHYRFFSYGDAMFLERDRSLESL